MASRVDNSIDAVVNKNAIPPNMIDPVIAGYDLQARPSYEQSQRSQ